MVKESDKISQREIDHMVKTGKRYFSGTWDNYNESPYAEHKRYMDRIYGEQRIDKSDSEL